MCGIVGAASKQSVLPVLLAGLHKLEYRGYDSAGVALIDNHGELVSARMVGNVSELEKKLKQDPLQGNIGIAHTRWATHGKPCEKNAHPHLSHQRIAVVHNGIIENHHELRQQLQAQGIAFASETDTEVISHLIYTQLEKSKHLLEAVQHAVKHLEGSFSIAILDLTEPEHILAVRQASPLVIGIGKNQNFLASDQLALLSETQQFIYLEEGDIADISAEKIIIYDAHGTVVTRPVKRSELADENVGLGNYRYFMEKEIYQQPQAIKNTLEDHLASDHVILESFGEKALQIFPQVENIQIIACGTSYHAAMVARYWLESHAKIPCAVEIASEFRYRDFIVQPNTLFITISQSGETADTLAALKIAKQHAYLASLAICNVAHSSLVREADMALMTRAGPEIGVASTKAFTTQLTALLLLTAVLSQQRNPKFDVAAVVRDLKQLPNHIAAVLELNAQIAKAATALKNKDHTLFLGRGIQYPIALEGALKLKEISYIHADAYPAGELKHGPLALVDEHMPVVVLAPNDALLEKLLSNIQEVQARGGELLVFADAKVTLPQPEKLTIIQVPNVPEILAPIVYTIPLQLFAYHVALLKGANIDKPRNLAKSVTVE